MNALTSYLRHLFVTGILILIEKLKLPLEGSEAAANYIALAIIGTLSWLFVKYVAPLIKIPKGSGMALFALSSTLAISMTSISCPSIPNDFFKGVSVRVKTDAGDIVGDQDGINGEIVIDQSSDK